MSSKPLRLEDEAVEELENGIAWYEGKRRGLGREFFTAVESALLAAREAPERWAYVPGVSARLAARRVIVARFPHSVVYVDEPAEVRVVAIAHFKRRPGYWIDR